MEAAQGGGGGGGGGRGGGSEVRRIHIIYFLSRKGRIEHPHLVRVHHLSRNGIRLRDVKRWLSELRGKDMPESFAWSYKRMYKTGFVWQDLLDEDLITPISDNEYVLKGSEIPSSDLDLRSHGEKKVPIQKDRSSTQERDPKLSRNKEQNDHHEEEEEEHQQTTMDVSTKTTSSEIEEESPPFGSETSTLTDESIKLEEEEEEEKHSDTNKQETTTEQQRDKFENSSSLYSTLLNKNKQKKKNKNNKKVVNPSTPASTATATASSFTKSKSYSGGATNMFRSFITCGAVDTNDSAMVMLNRRDKMTSSSCYVPISKQDDNTTAGRTQGICKGDKLGVSERVFVTSWNQQQKTHPNPNARKSFDGVKSSSNKKSEFNNQKPVSAAYRPVNGPNCSQCGKMFKPEKMHTHMKSCRGMKSLAKATSCSAAAAAAAASFEPRRSMDSSCEESVSGYYLAN